MTILITLYFLNSHGQISKTWNSELTTHVTYSSPYRVRTALKEAVEEAGGYPTSWNVVSVRRYNRRFDTYVDSRVEEDPQENGHYVATLVRGYGRGLTS
ncbi:hypothetical protein AAVH_41091 [Aphelenchoides avenae]|nr:hypothetical protein AAVH_41091 [Aphelenchus avenae]